MKEELFLSYVQKYGIFSLEKEKNPKNIDFSLNVKYNVIYAGRRTFYFYMRSYRQILETTVYTEEDNPILLVNNDILIEFIYMCNNFILRIHSDYNQIKKNFYIANILMNYDNQIVLVNTKNDSNLDNIKITIHLDNYYSIIVNDKIIERIYSLNDLLSCEILQPIRRTFIGNFKKLFGLF